MTFAYTILVSAAFLAGTALGGRTTQTEVTYENEEMQKTEETTTATAGMEKSGSVSWTSGGVLERSSNLKYVTAIRKSSMWTDVKKRTLTINSQVNSEIMDKSPETMSDQELVLVKQACHDALKCVAVDQLLVLKTIKQQTSDGDGKTGVHKAITKITKVITDYTDESHHDSYEYFAVSETDDSSKVYQSVTTIVEDNRELCKSSDDRNVDVSRDDSPAFGSDDRSEPVYYGSSSDDDDDPVAVDQQKQILQNFGTINNYNINQGTINSAVVNLGPSDGKSDGGRDAASADDDIAVRVTLGTDDESVSVNGPRPASDESAAREDDGASEHDSNDDFKEPREGDEKTPLEDRHDASGTGADNGAVNKLEIDNTNKGGCGDTNVDVAVSGANNESQVRKGYVDDGYLNNGDTKMYNINNGTINRGVISGSNAENGTISIGTINNGPISYENNNDSSVNSVASTLNNLNVQQYASNINDIYSKILDEFH